MQMLCQALIIQGFKSKILVTLR